MNWDILTPDIHKRDNLSYNLYIKMSRCILECVLRFFVFVLSFIILIRTLKSSAQENIAYLNVLTWIFCKNLFYPDESSFMKKYKSYDPPHNKGIVVLIVWAETVFKFFWFSMKEIIKTTLVDFQPKIGKGVFLSWSILYNQDYVTRVLELL